MSKTESGSNPKDIVARGVGSVVSENFWALVFAGAAAWFGWMAAFESDLEEKVHQAKEEIADLAERVARLEGQNDKGKR